MRKLITISIGLSLCLASSTALVAAAPEARFLPMAETAAEVLIPPPPVRQSQAEALEFARLRALIANTSAERLAQADADGAHEDPTVFNEALGRDLTKLPATLALLKAIQDETELVVDAAKLHFNRPRPYTIDPALPHCGKGAGKFKGYPSGHSGFSYSVGWALARLDPAHAPAVLARAQDYALSREICGVHFHSDTEASHVIGTFIADRMLADPRLTTQVSAARAELASQ
jgi:acid phosphatase (class A)